jgi:alkanesulfonate monooxygenase SsuD/methylene tetrahydromethanopterin reductase-like flavin-dependent oxidoreductase (luciferase family)
MEYMGSHLNYNMRFGLQHPIFDFDYRDGDTFQVFDTLKNLITKAESRGFDSFWVMDHFHQLAAVGTPDRPMLEGWTTISVLAGLTTS